MADSANDVQPFYDRPKQAQRRLGIGPTKFYELIAEGRIKTLKLGRATLVPIDQYPSFRERLEADSSRAA